MRLNFSSHKASITRQYKTSNTPQSDKRHFHQTQHKNYERVELEMWSGEKIVRYDVFDALQSNVNSTDCTMTTRTAVKKTLVGVITSNPDRVEGLLQDLGCMLNGTEHCVVVYVNVCDSQVGKAVSRMLKMYKYRSHVIYDTDRIVLETCNSICCNGESSFPYL